MSDTLTFSPAAISTTLYTHAPPYTPLNVRAQGPAPRTTLSVTLAGTPAAFQGTADLSDVLSRPWLTVPATAEDSVPFDLVLDASELQPGKYSTIVTGNIDGFDEAQLRIDLLVLPQGGPARRG